MTTAPFPIDPVLVAITVAYRNMGYIADMVLPRVMVGAAEFKYWRYPIEETLALPETRVGRRGRPNEVNLSAVEETDSTEDYGLEDPIPRADIDNAPANHRPVDRATSQITDYIMLDREVRAARLVFNSNSYPATNRVTLAGNDQWSDHDNSNPIDDIMTGLDICLIRPNVLVLGQAAFTKLATHPKVNKAIHGTSGDSGVQTRQAIANLFELEEVLVGQSRLNTAKKGQAAAIGRVWGKHCALIYRDRNADTRSGLTFGYTAWFGSRVAGSWDDRDIGLRGGTRVRVGESVKEKIVAGQAGYPIESAVA